jgi:hypothetical protein
VQKKCHVLFEWPLIVSLMATKKKKKQDLLEQNPLATFIFIIIFAYVYVIARGVDH